MNLSIPTNFDKRLIEEISSFPVSEVYGKMASDVVGGGRISAILPRIRWSEIAEHAKLCRRHGIRFNYLLNAANTDNIEYTRRGQRKLKQLIERLEKMGIQNFTVATPYLLRYLKRWNSKFRIKVSVFAQVGDVRKAHEWQEMGADEIVLDSLLVNREFDRLKEIRQGVRIPLRLLVNNNCTYGCAVSPYHMNVLASGSRSDSRTGGFPTDYCYFYCTAHKLSDPGQYLIADWVRPEDLSHYEAVGYSDFKLAGRNLPTEIILKRVKAYSDRCYRGNLLDLTQDFGQKTKNGNHQKGKPWSRGQGIRGFIKWAYRAAPWRISTLLQLWKLSKKRGFLESPSISAPAYIDNQALQGFLDDIIQMGGCRNRLCDDCRYCHKRAETAVRINEDSRQKILSIQKPLIQKIESGALWN